MTRETEVGDLCEWGGDGARYLKRRETVLVVKLNPHPDDRQDDVFEIINLLTGERNTVRRWATVSPEYRWRIL